MRKKDLRPRHYVIGTKDNVASVLGHTYSVQNALRSAIVAEGIPCSLYTDIFENLGANEFASLYTKVMDVELAPKLLTEQLALKIWEELDRQPIPFLKKASVRQVLVSLFKNVGTAFTKEELVYLIEAPWKTIQGTFPDMRRAGIDIKRNKGTAVYVRR